MLNINKMEIITITKTTDLTMTVLTTNNEEVEVSKSEYKLQGTSQGLKLVKI